jgi:hypothetical protein
VKHVIRVPALGERTPKALQQCLQDFGSDLSAMLPDIDVVWLNPEGPGQTAQFR